MRQETLHATLGFQFQCLLFQRKEKDRSIPRISPHFRPVASMDLWCQADPVPPKQTLLRVTLVASCAILCLLKSVRTAPAESEGPAGGGAFVSWEREAEEQ